MKKDTIAIIIITLCFITTLFLLPEKKPNKVYKKKCRIDSLETNLRYETLPDKVYIYHTECGKISLPRCNYRVGDSIEFTFYEYKTLEK